MEHKKPPMWPDKITPSVILDALLYLESISYDDERAHSYEDSLHCAVLEAIAQGRCENPEDCAAKALQSSSIDFSRWCA